MDKKTKSTKHQSNIEKKYELCLGNLTVEINYDKNQKKIDECMLNILKKKNKV